MRFFRKFTVWFVALCLAFLTMLSPVVQTSMEVKAYVTSSPYYFNEFTLLNGYTFTPDLIKTYLQMIFNKYDNYIFPSNGYRGDYYLTFGADSSKNDDGSVSYIRISVTLNIFYEPFDMDAVRVNESQSLGKGIKTPDYRSCYVIFNVEKGTYSVNTTFYQGSYYPFNCGLTDSSFLSDYTWNISGSFGLSGNITTVKDQHIMSFNSKTIQNRSLSRQQLKNWAFDGSVASENEYCSYKISPSVLTSSDKQILQSYDSDTGSTIYNQVTSLLSVANNSIYNLINGLNKIQKSITGTSAYTDSALAVLNKLMGVSNASGEGYYKDDNGVIHSYGGGVTRGGGAGRDGGTETVGNHQVQRCYDVDTGSYQPTGDIKINNTTSDPYNFTTENIYYITENYYINNNYEIIDGYVPPATDTDVPPATGTDTDVPPVVKPGDEWPEDTPSWIEFLGNLIGGLLQGLGDAIGGLGDAIGGIANALGNIISSLIDALTGLIKMLFIPSDNFMSDKLTSMNETVNQKLPVVGQVGTITSSVVSMMTGSGSSPTSSGAPSYIMQLPSWLGNGEFELFDFQFFDQHRTLFHAIISFCAWSLYLLRVPYKISNAMHKARKK